MIGTHTVNVYEERETPSGVPVDISCLLDGVSIRYGRTDTANQPEAASATLEITVGPGAPLPAVVDIGAWVVIDTHLAGTAYRRFTGRVTDLSLGWDDAGPDTPDAGIGQIVAVSTLADYARRVVGDEPFPQELDGARVARVLGLAGLTLDPLTSDPGTVNVISRDIDARAALEIAADTADSAGGLIWETPAGDIRYADAEHRRNTAVDLELDSCDILVTPTWVRNLSGMVNEISITYGEAPQAVESVPDAPPAAPVSNERPTYSTDAPESVAKYGRYNYAVTTELAELSDAQQFAWLILAQNSQPAWLLAALPVDMPGLAEAETATLLGLELHSLLRITGLPATGATPVSVMAWVEGWSERLAWGIHEIELTVSDYCRTAAPPLWDDMPLDVTWDSTDPALTWNQAACMGGPIADLGRWDDVAATTRWDSVAASVEWDETAGGIPA